MSIIVRICVASSIQPRKIIEQFDIKDCMISPTTSTLTPNSPAVVGSQNTVASEESEITPSLYIESYMARNHVKIPIIRSSEI